MLHTLKLPASCIFNSLCRSESFMSPGNAQNNSCVSPCDIVLDNLNSVFDICTSNFVWSLIFYSRGNSVLNAYFICQYRTNINGKINWPNIRVDLYFVKPNENSYSRDFCYFKIFQNSDKIAKCDKNKIKQFKPFINCD